MRKIGNYNKPVNRQLQYMKKKEPTKIIKNTNLNTKQK